MGLFKKHVTCITTFFILFIYITLCQFYSITSRVLFTKNSNLPCGISPKRTNYGMKEKNIFVCMAASAYHYIKGGGKSHYGHSRIFRHTCMCKQASLTKQWNYNIFVQILYGLSVTLIGSWMCFFFVVVRCNIIGILSETKKKRLSQRKKYIEESV